MCSVSCAVLHLIKCHWTRPERNFMLARHFATLPLMMSLTVRRNQCENRKTSKNSCRLRTDFYEAFKNEILQFCRLSLPMLWKHSGLRSRAIEWGFLMHRPRLRRRIILTIRMRRHLICLLARSINMANYDIQSDMLFTSCVVMLRVRRRQFSHKKSFCNKLRNRPRDLINRHRSPFQAATSKDFALINCAPFCRIHLY